MGGMGSGGHNRKGRATTADAFSLDANILRRAGVLVAGWAGGWHWTRDGERAADIGIRHDTADQLTMNYRTRAGTGPWIDVSQVVAVAWAPCRFGGARPFLCCPCCGRRAVKLYILNTIMCRACHGLPYPTQRMDAVDRLRWKAGAVRVKLGGRHGGVFSVPAKPKGMHWRTYDRLRNRALEADWRADMMMDAQLDRLCARLGVTDMDLDL